VGNRYKLLHVCYILNTAAFEEVFLFENLLIKAAMKLDTTT